MNHEKFKNKILTFSRFS